MDSKLGVGSRFCVEVSCALVENDIVEADVANWQDVSCPRILLVEDDPIYRELSTSILDSFAQVSVACDGEEAIEAFSGQPFDMVLMDIRMPKVDGLFATRRIRDIEKKRNSRRTPIWGVSANTGVETIKAARLAGMDDLFAKPLTVSLVRDLVAAVRPAEPARS